MYRDEKNVGKKVQFNKYLLPTGECSELVIMQKILPS